jgi:hypothetical protein
MISTNRQRAPPLPPTFVLGPRMYVPRITAAKVATPLSPWVQAMQAQTIDDREIVCSEIFHDVCGDVDAPAQGAGALCCIPRFVLAVSTGNPPPRLLADAHTWMGSTHSFQKLAIYRAFCNPVVWHRERVLHHTYSHVVGAACPSLLKHMHQAGHELCLAPCQQVRAA